MIIPGCGIFLRMRSLVVLLNWKVVPVYRLGGIRGPTER